MPNSVNEAFVELINENLGIAKKVSRIYFSDADDREDAQQEMMYQLWRSYAQFDGRSKFSTWMYRVCLNTALTYKKKVAKQSAESISEEHHEIADQPCVSTEEPITFLFDVIATLSALNKAIILLYLEDMSYEEIASITGISKSNVSVRLVRIKNELEVKLKNKL